MVLLYQGSLRSSISSEMGGFSPELSAAASCSPEALGLQRPATENDCSPATCPENCCEYKTDDDHHRGPCMFVSLVAHYLERHLHGCESSRRGVSAAGEGERLTCFHGSRLPTIALQSYISRLAKYGRCSLVCFVMAVVYLERLVKKDDAHRLVPLNTHRLLLTSVLLAAKLTDDDYFNNAYYAKVGGIPASELNRLELEMLKLLDFRLSVSVEEVETMLETMRTAVQQGESCRSVSWPNAITPSEPSCGQRSGGSLSCRQGSEASLSGESTPSLGESADSPQRFDAALSESSSASGSATSLGSHTQGSTGSASSFDCTSTSSSSCKLESDACEPVASVCQGRAGREAGRLAASWGESQRSGVDVADVGHVGLRQSVIGSLARRKPERSSVAAAEQDILGARQTRGLERCVVDDCRVVQHVAQEPVLC